MQARGAGAGMKSSVSTGAYPVASAWDVENVAVAGLLERYQGTRHAGGGGV